jgi:hypothetical protein
VGVLRVVMLVVVGLFRAVVGKPASLSPHPDIPFPAIPDSNGHACEVCIKKQHLIFPLLKTKNFKQKKKTILSGTFLLFICTR